MSTLEEALTALVPKPKPQGCKSCAWLAGQTDSVQNHVRDWVIEGHSTKQLYEVLRAHGYPLSISAFKFHNEHVKASNGIGQ